MADGFYAQCDVAVTNTYNTCGTVTRANISRLSPSAIKALFTGATSGAAGVRGWNEMNSLLKHQIEMRACGIVRSPLYDWLFSSSKRGMGALVNVQTAHKGPSLIQPYILGQQQSLWNADHWIVTTNVLGSAYTDPGTGDEYGDSTPGPGMVTTGGTAGSGQWMPGDASAVPPFSASGYSLKAVTGTNRVLTVRSSFGGTMELHPEYFRPGVNLHMISRAVSGAAFSITQFKVVQAARNVDQSLDIEVVVNQPNRTESGNLAVASFPSDPTNTGLLFVGINNVADVEAWCYNRINVNLTKLVPFWYQTFRETRCVSEMYEEFLGKMMEENAWYAKFQDLPMAERNRQDEQRARKEEMNAFFFGERISNKQNLENWSQLDVIKTVSGATVDPGTGDVLMGYRANMIGVMQQMADCGRVKDSGGVAGGYSIKTFIEDEIYNVHRARQSMGRPCTEIDCYTDSTTALEFMKAFIDYSKDIVTDIVRINVDQGFTEWGFPFYRFRLYKPVGVFLNIITDPFFDDLATAAGYTVGGTNGVNYGLGMAGIGKFLMVLDLGSGGTVYPAVIASNRKQYTVGDINDLARIDNTYSCVMENPRIRKTLTSKTLTAVVECPMNSYIVCNFEKLVK